MGISADIRTKAFEILEGSQNGIRFSELVRKIHDAIPGSNLNTINGSIWDLDRKNKNTVYKPAKGIFKLIKYKGNEEAVEVVTHTEEVAAERKTKLEESFYEPFRKWFIAELSDCNTAIVLGGAKSKIKWSNPDVLGTRKPEFDAIMKFPPEIVSTEIKTSTADQDLITGFGQACAYRLFSHKSYLVIPNTAKPEIIDRLEAMCSIFGIGFILFNVDNKDSPDFRVLVRAIKNEPDMYYVNEFIEELDKKHVKELLF